MWLDAGWVNARQGEDIKLVDETIEGIEWTIPFKQAVKSIEVLGMNGKVKFENVGESIKVSMKPGMPDSSLPLAVVFKMHVYAFRKTDRAFYRNH